MSQQNWQIQNTVRHFFYKAQLISNLPVIYYSNIIFYFQASFDSLHIEPSEGGHSPGRPTHRRYHSGGSFKFLPPPDLPESPPRGVVPTRKAEASRYTPSTVTFSVLFILAVYPLFFQLKCT